MANQLEALRATYGKTWDLHRRGITYVAVRRAKLTPDQQSCGLSDEIQKNSFGEFAAELRRCAR